MATIAEKVKTKPDFIVYGQEFAGIVKTLASFGISLALIGQLVTYPLEGKEHMFGSPDSLIALAMVGLLLMRYSSDEALKNAPPADKKKSTPASLQTAP